MLKFIDNKLNNITMYRLVLYYLIGLLGVALVLCGLNILPYSPFALLLTIGILTAISLATNTLFARTFKVPANVESVYISALILALIITPLSSTHDLGFLAWAAILSMASKYILAINGKHIFNPIAIAVALTAITTSQTASWWVGTVPMLPFVLIGGLLVVRKIRRFTLVSSFLVAAFLTIVAFSFLKGDDILANVINTALYSPLFFFAFIIITEPLTTPPTLNLQIYYGMMVGFLFSPQIHLGSFYTTPEIAIVIGNIFSYIVSPKAKLILTLKEKIQLGPDIYDFIFTPNRKLAFAPGQYMEWTLGHPHPDSRGNRRYFTLASSPTENELRLGVKFYQNSSSYKKSMLAMKSNTEIVAAQLAGDFVLPEDRRRKCVFIAGGIGITPFRSMIKYMLDTNQKRPTVLFYANKTVSEIVYKDVFDKAQVKLGLKTIYTLTDKNKIPAGWNGKVGYIDAKMIKQEVPDFGRCTFYLSGPNAMVTAFEAVLTHMGVSRENIKMDFFPGLT